MIVSDECLDDDIRGGNDGNVDGNQESSDDMEFEEMSVFGGVRSRKKKARQNEKEGGHSTALLGVESLVTLRKPSLVSRKT